MTSRAVKVNLTLTSTKANAPQTNTIISGTTITKSNNNKINTSIESPTPSSAMNKMPNETNVPQDSHMKQEDKQQVHTVQKTNINATKISVNNTQIKETTSKHQHQEEAATTKARSLSPVTITIRSNNGLRVNNTKTNTADSVNITNKNSEKQNNIVLAKAQQQKQQQQMTGNSKKDNNQIMTKEQGIEINNNLNKTSKDVHSKQDASNAQLLSLSAIPHRHVSILPSPVPSASLEHVVNDKSPYSNTSIPIKSNIKSNVNTNNNKNKNRETVNKESNNTNNTAKLNTTKQMQEKDKTSSLEPTNLNVTTPVTLEKATHVQTENNNTANNKINNVANTNTNMTLQHVAMTSTPEKEELTQEVQKETSVTKPQKQRMRRRQTPSRSDRVMFQEVIATSVVKASRRSHSNNVNNCTKNSVNTNSVDEKPITSEMAKEESNVQLDSPTEHNSKTNNISNEVQTKKICNNSSSQSNDIDTHANCKTQNTKAASVVDINKENNNDDVIHRLLHHHHHHHHKGKTKVRAKEGEVQTEEEHVSKSIAQKHQNKTENVKHMSNNKNDYTSKQANDNKANVNKCIVKEDASVQTVNSSFDGYDDNLEQYKTDGEQDEESDDSNSSDSKSYSENEDNNNNNNNKAEKVYGVNKQNINSNEHKSKLRKPVHVQFSVDGSNDDDDDEINSYDNSSTNDNEEEKNPLRQSNYDHTTEDKQENGKELHAYERKQKINAEPLSAQVEEKAQYGQERHPCFVNTNPVHHNTNLQEQQQLHGLYYEETEHPEKKYHKHTTTTTHHHNHHHHKRQERVVHFLDALFAPDYTEKIKSLPVSSHEAVACKYTSEQPVLSLNIPPPIPVQSTSTSFYRNAINANAHTIVHNMNITEEYTYEELRTQQLALEEPLFLYYSSLHAAVHLYPGDYVTIEPILNNTTIAATHANTFHTNTTTTTTDTIPPLNNCNHKCMYPAPYKYGFYRFSNNSNAANSQTLFNYSFPPSQSALLLQQQKQQQYQQQQQEIVNTQNNSNANIIIDNNNETIANNANKEAIGNTTSPVTQAQAQAQKVTPNVNSQPQSHQQQQQRVPIQLI